MKLLTIDWRNEFKNCVRFAIFVNGCECGNIKRGEVQTVPVHDGHTELYFVPQAPKFYGWRALKLKTNIYGATPEIYLTIMSDKNGLLQSFQLRCRNAVGVDILQEELIKKYR